MSSSPPAAATADDPARPRPAARPSGWFSRLVLGPDTDRQLNLKITLGGQLGYVCNLGLIWYLVHVGLMDADLAWPVTLAVAASMLVFYVLLRTGWSRKFADPGLTVPQMINAIVFSAVGSVSAPALHIGLLMPVATTLAYSVFALQARQVRLIQLITMAVFMGTSVVMCRLQPQYYQPYIEVYVLGALALTAVMLTWSGSRLAHLRGRQRRQREELTALLGRIETLASRDTLTGLHNRRHMNVLLAHHAERALRGDARPTLALIDLDYFKRVNDTYGHGVGDEALKRFAEVMQAALPCTDALARWGGEEFMLLSTTSPGEVLALLERVRQQLAQTQIAPEQPELRINFSAGVAMYQPEEQIADTVHRADDALYEAKEAGRARSCLASFDAAAAKSARAAVPLAGDHASVPPGTPLRPLPEGLPALPALAVPMADETAPVADAPLERDEQAADGSVAAGPLRHVWLLGRDARHRSWTARSMVGALPYFFGMLSVLYLVEVDSMQGDIAWKVALGLILTPALVYGLARSGWTARLDDPTITLTQMLMATTWTAVLYVTTAHAHSAQLIFLVMLMTISVCNMRRGGAWIVCLYAMVLMTTAMWHMSRVAPQVYVPEIELGNWILMMFNLPTLMLMGTQLSKLHARLRRQRVQLKEAVERLGQLATYDELTGLNNRTYMNEMLAHYRRRSAQANEVFTLALIDLDHFKQINDRYGHAVGDEVLQAFARLAAETLRQIDVIARWGGEEFLVLWPQTSPEQAVIGLERLRRAFAGLEVSHAVPDLRASFSAGLVSPQGEESIEKALASADEALYNAKRAGRNRACVHGTRSNQLPVD